MKKDNKRCYNAILEFFSSYLTFLSNHKFVRRVGSVARGVSVVILSIGISYSIATNDFIAEGIKFTAKLILKIIH